MLRYHLFRMETFIGSFSFPDQMFHIVCPEGDSGIALLPDSIQVVTRIGSFQLDQVKGFLVQNLCQFIPEITVVESFSDIGFFEKSRLISILNGLMVLSQSMPMKPDCDRIAPGNLLHREVMFDCIQGQAGDLIPCIA